MSDVMQPQIATDPRGLIFISPPAFADMEAWHETAAEIRMMERDGCDLVGMTAMPEAVLARELDIAYATLAVVANHAAGKGDSRQAISMEAIGQVLDAAMGRVRAILGAFLKAVD